MLERKWLLFTWNVVTLTRKKKGDDLPPSLERAIMDGPRGNPSAGAGFGRGQCIVSSPKENRVKTVVMRVIREGRDDPWEWVVGYVKKQLVKEGVLIYPRYELERKILWPYWSEELILPVPADAEALAPLASEACCLC